MSAPWQSIKLKPTVVNGNKPTNKNETVFEMPKLKSVIKRDDDFVVLEKPSLQANSIKAIEVNKAVPVSSKAIQANLNPSKQSAQELAAAIARFPEDAFEH